jgi:hypothetical protein
MKPIIVIKQHRPWQRWAIVAGSAFALALGGWALHAYTRATTVSDFERAQLERDRLRAENQRLVKELRAARDDAQKAHDDAAYAQRSADIDRQACAEVKSSLAGLQSEAADLREQLAFYRGIVTPREANAGMRVYDFHVTHDLKAGLYHFDLVLIQSARHDRRVGGRIDITVGGVQGGLRKTLKMSDIADGGARNLVFSFKYFEEFGGDFRLPDGFRPLRATVAVVPDGNGQPKFESEYDWSKIEQESLLPS